MSKFKWRMDISRLKNGLGQKVKETAIITGAMGIIAAAVFFFLIPSQASVSSIVGVAIIIKGIIDLPISLITLALNGVLIVVGLLAFGKGFASNTLYSCVLISVFLAVLEVLFPHYDSLTGSAALDVVCYILVVSWGTAILFSHNAASGGLDILAQILNKYMKIEVGKALPLIGTFIALSSAFVYDSKTVVLSVLGTYFNGLVLDRFMFGRNIQRRVSIISSYENELRKFILNELHCGATVYKAVGAYTNEEFQELVVIVNKNEYYRLMCYVRQLDPDAFAAVYTVADIRRKPWSN